jgi:hypothetical protein
MKVGCGRNGSSLGSGARNADQKHFFRMPISPLQKLKRSKDQIMKLNKMMVFTAALTLVAGMAKAAHVWEDPNAWTTGIFVYDTGTAPKFTANELSLDLFGSFTGSEQRIEDLFETNIRHGFWGGGVGLNYFITREIGLGVDANMPANHGALVDEVLGNLILRLPIESIGLAPYVFGGGGRGIDPQWEWIGQAGVGLEFRFNPTVGIFTDARYLWLDHTSDKVLLRAGLRLVF